ncbi:MAG: hypothetical protein MJY84_05245 [Bacteroidales bacterium]|nr:hypothetical protein [Bacteroidales bacterium]
MKRKYYIKPTCEPASVEMDSLILAESTNNNSVVSSVGQEVGVDVTFETTEYINTTWETGF